MEEVDLKVVSISHYQDCLIFIAIKVKSCAGWPFVTNVTEHADAGQQVESISGVNEKESQFLLHFKFFLNAICCMDSTFNSCFEASAKLY